MPWATLEIAGIMWTRTREETEDQTGLVVVLKTCFDWCIPQL